MRIASKDEIERMLLAYSPKFQSILRNAEQEIREGKGITHEDFWRELDEEMEPREPTAPGK